MVPAEPELAPLAEFLAARSSPTLLTHERLKPICEKCPDVNVGPVNAESTVTGLG
jgi:hypothetical protein